VQGLTTSLRKLLKFLVSCCRNTRVISFSGWSACAYGPHRYSEKLHEAAVFYSSCLPIRYTASYEEYRYLNASFTSSSPWRPPESLSCWALYLPTRGWPGRLPIIILCGRKFPRCARATKVAERNPADPRPARQPALFASGGLDGLRPQAETRGAGGHFFGGPAGTDCQQSIQEYDLLRAANLTSTYHRYSRSWMHQHASQHLAVDGRLQGFFGKRTDPFSVKARFTRRGHHGLHGTPVHARPMAWLCARI